MDFSNTHPLKIKKFLIMKIFKDMKILDPYERNKKKVYDVSI